MKIVVTELPKSDWWARGMPAMSHNWLMTQSKLPRPDVVRMVHARFLETLQTLAEVVVLPFPEEFDKEGHYGHDFIFIRDSFISNGKGEVIISNFSAKERAAESGYIRRNLDMLGVTGKDLSPDAYAEGGEFYYLPKEQLLFAGMTRNSKKGIDEVAAFLEVKNVCIVQTPAFHLDTNFTVLLDGSGACIGALACKDAITNLAEVTAFLNNHSIPLYPLDSIDGMGEPSRPGNFAANSLALPGILFGSAPFKTPGMEDKLTALGIRHIVVPLEDLTLSGGSVHCLTNELVF